MTTSPRSIPYAPVAIRRSGAEVNPWVIAVVVSIATFMEVLDTSIANVSLPYIAGGLSASVNEATWVLTSYLISNAIILPISGWLSTVIGRKRFYMSCVALFTISSLCCGMAPSLSALIFFRVLQGMGGGGLAPSEQAILTDTFPPAKRGMAFALYGVAVVVAPAIGPTLGGWITDSFTWRWIFFINVPVGMLSLLLSYHVVRDPPFLVSHRKQILARGIRFDYVGFGLISLGLASLQVVLDKGQEDDWFGSNFIKIFFLLAAVGLVCGVIWEMFLVRDPIVQLNLLRQRTFFASNAVMLALGIFLFGSTVLLPLLCQTLLGYTAMQSGLVITPGGVAIMAMMPVVGYLTGKVEARWLVLFGLVMSFFALRHMTNFDLGTSYGYLAVARIFQAVAIAFLFVPINTAAYAGLRREDSNNASALLNLFRNIGGSFGISVVTTILARRSQFHQSVLVSRFTPFNPHYLAAQHSLTRTLMSQGVNAVLASHKATATLMSMVERQASMLSYNDAFWVLSIIALVISPLVFLMRPNRPDQGAPAGH
ncbi:MAG TPA: DHA2 family efflux MFS transporter permease subunit [Tepidisphaeraceae bacterium]|jgi:DHA2 family multidrug resistance protein|nr:DHA2 family efflux MFS transporter permease subunit [Tepidisphaeraceae bacterium]